MLQAAGIPRVGPLALSAAEYNDKNSYPTSGGAVVMFQGAVLHAKQAGGKGIYIVFTATEGSGIIPNLLGGVIQSAGMQNKGQVGIPPGTPDLSTYVTKAMQSGADYVLTTFGPDLTQQFLQTAVQLGAKFKITTVAEAMSDDVISKVGKDQPLVSSALLTSPFPPIADNSNAGVKQFNTELDAAEKAGAKELKASNRSITMNAWLAAYAFGEVAKTIPAGGVTAKSLTTAMDTVKDVDMLGIIPPWTPSKSGGMFARVSNGTGWYLKIVDGKQVLDATTPQQILAAPAS